MAIFDRFKNAWNAFKGRDPTTIPPSGFGYSHQPTMRRHYGGSERYIIDSIYNRIAVDCSSVNINHVRVNEEGRFDSFVRDGLNRVLSRSANIDQTGRAFILDAVLSMMQEGVVALVPTVTDLDPNQTDSYTVEEAKVGKIVEWWPRQIRVELYDDIHGEYVQKIFDKRYVAIVNNPFYEIMNGRNSTLQRLSRVLNQLDKLNDEVALNKLDLIIQLPYTVKSDARKKIADNRVKNIEAQLSQGQYGVAYIDGTEKVIQLNRSLENNLWNQARDLQEDLYNQLGLTKAIFDGSADEKTMLNYNNRTIEPIMSAIVEEIERKWLTKTAITQGHAIRFFKDPFKLVPVAQLAEIADKFTRNEIMTSNEIRAVISMLPAKDPKADQLINSNLNQPEDKVSDAQKSRSSVNVDEIVSRFSK